MKKSNKVIILTAMILLLAVTAVFNFILTQADAAETTTVSNYFEEFKSERRTNRNEELLELNSIISNENADEDIISEALQQKLTIVQNMEKELQLENDIKAQGFTDVVISINFDSGKINAIVQDDDLTLEESIIIYTLIQEGANAGPDDVYIIPIKSTSN